jgi:hypothetical protein
MRDWFTYEPKIFKPVPTNNLYKWVGEYKDTLYEVWTDGLADWSRLSLYSPNDLTYKSCFRKFKSFQALEEFVMYGKEEE